MQHDFQIFPDRLYMLITIMDSDTIIKIIQVFAKNPCILPVKPNNTGVDAPKADSANGTIGVQQSSWLDVPTISPKNVALLVLPFAIVASLLAIYMYMDVDIANMTPKNIMPVTSTKLPMKSDPKRMKLS